MEKAVQLEQLRDVHESLTEMIKQVANEPSIGLYFVQQHVHKVVPTVVSLKVQLVESSQAAVLSTEDAKDALTLVRTMNEVGPSKIGKMKSILNSTISALQYEQNVKRSTVQLGSSISEGIGQAAIGKSLFNLHEENIVNSGSSESYCEDSTSTVLSTIHGSMEATLLGRGSPGIARSFWDAALNRNISNAVARKASNMTKLKGNIASTDSSRMAELQTEMSSRSYFHSAFESALQKAGNIGWKTSAANTSCDMSFDATEASEAGSFLNTTAEVLKDFAFIKPARYVRAVFDSTQQRSDYGAKDDEKKLQVDDVKGKNIVEEVGSSMYLKDLILQDSYEQFQEERKAKLEAWLENSEEPASTQER